MYHSNTNVTGNISGKKKWYALRLKNYKINVIHYERVWDS